MHIQIQVDVDKDIKLPPKREIIVYTPVTKIQTMLYKKACSGELLKIAFEKRSPFDSKFKTSDPFLQKYLLTQQFFKPNLFQPDILTNLNWL